MGPNYCNKKDFLSHYIVAKVLKGGKRTDTSENTTIQELSDAVGDRFIPW